MMNKLIVFSAALLLSSCADRGYYKINGQSVHVREAALADIEKAWKNQPQTIFARSAAPDVAWIIELIAVSEARGIGAEPPCKSLTAIGIKSLPLARFTLPSTAKQSLEYSPVRYREQWTVNACGNERQWGIFDNPKDSDPLNVVLLRAR